MDNEFTSPYWLSFNQAKKLGGTVRKGSKSTMVIFWKVINKVKTDDEGEEYTDSFAMLRYYRVFNTDQVDFPEGYELPQEEEREFTPIESCEQLVSEYQISLQHGGVRACYFPKKDKIHMPLPERFHSPENYYATLFHELVHSTGHPERLSRFDYDQFIPSFGSNDYSKEELVAEFGAAMLCGMVGIAPHVIDNSASYIKEWLRVLNDDKMFLVQAASKAQKAADYIRGVEWGSESKEVNKEVPISEAPPKTNPITESGLVVPEENVIDLPVRQNGSGVIVLTDNLKRAMRNVKIGATPTRYGEPTAKPANDSLLIFPEYGTAFRAWPIKKMCYLWDDKLHLKYDSGWLQIRSGNSTTTLKDFRTQDVNVKSVYQVNLVRK